MRLVLVRHGQSTWNVAGRLQGQTMDVPLTELGRAQARVAAERIGRLVPMGTPVVTSDQLRARQTAEPLGMALGVQPQPTALLREQALGKLEGRFAKDLSPEPVPEGLDISEVAWGGGESVQQVHARCRTLLRWLEQDFADAEVLVLVGHGDTLRILLAAIAGRCHRDVDWNLTIGNGEVLDVEWPTGH